MTYVEFFFLMFLLFSNGGDYAKSYSFHHQKSKSSNVMHDPIRYTILQSTGIRLCQYRVSIRRGVIVSSSYNSS